MSNKPKKGRPKFLRAKQGEEALETRSRGVTHRMEMGAYMDALGMDTKEIADIVGVHIKTVSHWRGTKDYMERVAYWRERGIEQLDPIINRLKIDAAHMVDVAIQTLIDAMKNSEHADGRPNYAMRTAAAREALSSSIARLTIGADQAAVANINASQQTVTLVFNEAPAEPAPEDEEDFIDVEVAELEALPEVPGARGHEEPVAVEIDDDTKEENDGEE